MSTRTEEIEKHVKKILTSSEPFLETLRVLNSNLENSRKTSDLNLKCDVNEIISKDVQCIVKELKNNIDKLDTNIDTIRELCKAEIRFPRGRRHHICHGITPIRDSGLADSITSVTSTFDSLGCNMRVSAECCQTLAVQESEPTLSNREGKEHDDGLDSPSEKDNSETEQ